MARLFSEFLAFARVLSRSLSASLSTRTDRLERAGGSPSPADLSANVFQICSALEFLSSTWMGNVDWTVGCYSLGLVFSFPLSSLIFLFSILSAGYLWTRPDSLNPPNILMRGVGTRTGCGAPPVRGTAKYLPWSRSKRGGTWCA